MLGFIAKRIRAGHKNSGGKNSVPRLSLYCVWIRAHEGENAPLIRMWIDPGMTLFESQATLHEPDLATARAEVEAAIKLKSVS